MIKEDDIWNKHYQFPFYFRWLKHLTNTDPRAVILNFFKPMPPLINIKTRLTYPMADHRGALCWGHCILYVYLLGKTFYESLLSYNLCYENNKLFSLFLNTEWLNMHFQIINEIPYHHYPKAKMHHNKEREKAHKTYIKLKGHRHFKTD